MIPGSVTLYGESPRLSRRSGLTSVTKRPLRADAQRNYDAIVLAALDVFVEQGTQGSLDDIATRAGVANATLYRRLPAPHELALAGRPPPPAGADRNVRPRLHFADARAAARVRVLFHPRHPR